MRFDEWGRVVKGVNTTPDVNVNSISQEAAKLGFKVDKDGKPPLLSKKVSGPTTNVLSNIGLTKTSVSETIRKVTDNKWRLYSKKGKNLGTFNSLAAAKKHEREVQYFKHNEGKFTPLELAIMEGGHSLHEDVTQGELNSLEKILDKVFGSIGIDVNFTRHFLDRINDPRNETPISIKELAMLFKKEYQQWGRPIAQMGPDKEAVMKDLASDINVPFALTWDRENNELDMIAKTIMRKKNFHTPNKEFSVEAVAVEPDPTGYQKDKLEEALGELDPSTEIYVDMDGVLADFFGEWARLMGKEDWRDIKDVSPALAKIRATDDFWLKLPVLPQAKQLLALIKQVKGEYNICTSPLADDPNSEPHKRVWIEKNLGFFPPKNVYITHNKPQYATNKNGKPNILIDDYGVNIDKWEAAGGIGFKYKDHKFERTAQELGKLVKEPEIHSENVTAEGKKNPGLWANIHARRKKGLPPKKPGEEGYPKTLNIEEGINDPDIFKAVFLVGGPGSGKSYVASKVLAGNGLKNVNSDEVYEFLMRKAGLNLDAATIASPQGQKIRDEAKRLDNTRMGTYINGRLGLILDGTGKSVEKIQKQAEMLRQMGYSTMMIFVNTSLDIAQARNLQRARQIPSEMVSKMWNTVQENLMKFQQIFGSGKFHIIDNSGGLEDLDRKQNFDKVYNETQRFLNTPPRSKAALAWIQKQKAQNDDKRSERTTAQPTNTNSDGGVGASN